MEGLGGPWRDGPSQQIEEEVTEMADATIAVKEIHCASCENTIRVALSRLDGV
ncbi:MAG: heavy-metal-associated domain-containing protein, partial [Chloroflexota bacterium]